MLKYFFYLSACLTEATPGNHGSQALYSATSFASAHKIQKFAVSNKLTFVMYDVPATYFSPSARQTFSLCIISQSHKSYCFCFSYLLTTNGAYKFLSQYINMVYILLFSLTVTLNLLICCSCKVLTWNAFSQKKNISHSLYFCSTERLQGPLSNLI